MVTSESVVLALELVTGRVLRIVVARLISADDSICHCLAQLWAVWLFDVQPHSHAQSHILSS